jgi:uncharacterized membrane-anchored protein YhcB (DUF1043 family)
MTGVVMTALILLVGLLIGLLGGALISIRFVRQEVMGNLGPQLQQMRGQLNSIEAEITYLASSRYAEITAQLSHDPRRQNL